MKISFRLKFQPVQAGQRVQALQRVTVIAAILGLAAGPDDLGSVNSPNKTNKNKSQKSNSNMPNSTKKRNQIVSDLFFDCWCMCLSVVMFRVSFYHCRFSCLTGRFSLLNIGKTFWLPKNLFKLPQACIFPSHLSMGRHPHYAGM